MKHRILVIDDDSDVCDLLQVVLEGAGRFDVRIETRSVMALETAKSFLPDLILLDVNMPGKSGVTVAREFAAEATLASRPILFLTGFVDASEAGFVVGAGQNYLAKTAGSEALLEAVDRLLGSSA